MARKRFSAKWTIEVEVDGTWIADGFNPDADAFRDAILSNMLGYAYPDEVKVQIIKAPSEDERQAAIDGTEG